MSSRAECFASVLIFSIFWSSSYLYFLLHIRYVTWHLIWYFFLKLNCNLFHIIRFTLSSDSSRTSLFLSRHPWTVFSFFSSSFLFKSFISIISRICSDLWASPLSMHDLKYDWYESNPKYMLTSLNRWWMLTGLVVDKAWTCKPIIWPFLSTFLAFQQIRGHPGPEVNLVTFIIILIPRRRCERRRVGWSQMLMILPLPAFIRGYFHTS